MVRPRKRMEERRRKRNRLKATMAGLILSLVVGSAQGLSTYALFTDKVDLAQSISISLGDLDAQVSEGFAGESVKKDDNNGNIVSKNFKITNNGTLKQSLNLALEFGKDISDEVLKNITYTIESLDKKFNTISGTMDTLKSGKDIVSGNGKLLVLEPNTALNCKATVTFGEPALTALSEKTLDFNLVVNAKQVNWTEGGFYDVANQSNSIVVEKAKPDIGDNEGVVEFEYCPCGSCHNISTSERSKAFKIDISSIAKDRKLESQGIDEQWYVDSGNKPGNNDEFYLHVADSKEGVLYVVPASGYTATIDEIVNRGLKIQLTFVNYKTEFYQVKFEERDGFYIAMFERIPAPYLEIQNTAISNPAKVDEGLNSEASVPVVEENLEAPNKDVAEPVIKEEVESSNVEVIEPVEEENLESSNTEVVEPVKEEEIEPSNLNNLEAIKKEELQE